MIEFERNGTESLTDLGKLCKIVYGGSILGSSKYTLMPQLPPKMMLGLKVVKIDSKIKNSLR